MASVLYAARGGSLTTSDLYTVDPATAVMTSVGPIGFAMTALMFSPAGLLYGITSNNSAVHHASLVRIDPVTGAGTFIGALGLGAASLSDAAFDNAGNLWGWNSGGGLVSVDPATGVATIITTTPSNFGGALDFDSNDVLWHIGGGDGFSETVDLATGAVTHMGSVASHFLQAGKYDVDAVFWASERFTSTVAYLVKVNPLSGVVTDIATFPASSVDALAWSGVSRTRRARGIFDGGPAFKGHA